MDCFYLNIKTYLYRRITLKPMNKITLPIVAALVLAALYSCKTAPTDNFEEMARRATTPDAVIVETVELKKSTFYHELISNGKAYSSARAVVPFRVNGIINELTIKNGQHVNKGDLLAVIDDYQYRASVVNARNALDRAEINFKDDLLKTYFVTDTANLSPSQIRMSRIRSGINDAEAALELAEYNYNNTRIYAPISGSVTDLTAKQWNPSQNYANLCSIVDDEYMEVEFPVIESEYSFISTGMPIEIMPFIDAAEVIEGTVSEINPQVDQNGMISVKARFKNNNRLIDGMNVRVAVRKPEPDRFVVPKEALVIRQGRDVIFVRQDSLAIWKYVIIEFENSTSVSISEGLEEGDLVIVSGNINLAHETVVKE